MRARRTFRYESKTGSCRLSRIESVEFDIVKRCEYGRVDHPQKNCRYRCRFALKIESDSLEVGKNSKRKDYEENPNRRESNRRNNHDEDQRKIGLNKLEIN